LTEALPPAIDLVEREWREKGGDGALVIVGNTKQDKFFSNGLVVEELQTQQDFIPNALDPLAKRLLSFPIPIVCALNGHTFAAGLAVALACDYRVMKGSRAWCCLNEVHFGAPLPPSLAALLRAKIGDPRAVRKCGLEGHRFSAQEALSVGLVDRVVEGGSKEVLAAALELAQDVKGCAKTGVWGAIKSELYRDVLSTIAEGRRMNFAKL